MKSKILSANLIWENMKKQIWIPALILLTFLLVYPISVVRAFESWTNYQTMTANEIMAAYLRFIRQDLAYLGMMLMGMAALVNGIFGFSWLHSRQKIDFYHSLPVKREALYWNQTVIGILFAAFPNIVVSVLSLCIGAAQGYFSLKIAGTMLGTVGIQIVAYLLIYEFAVLAMMLTGRLLVGILGALGFVTYFPGVTLLLTGYADMFFTTYSSNGNINSVYDWITFRYGSPISWYLSVIGKIGNSRSFSWLEIVGALLVCVVLLALNLWVYKRRPSEGTGNSMVFCGFGKVVKFLVEIPAALLTGILACNIVSEHRAVWWGLGLIVGLVLVHGIMEVIYQMDFRKFFSHRIELGLEGVCMVLLVSVFLFDLTGYDAYLPEQDELTAVSFNPDDLSGNSESLVIRDASGYLTATYDIKEKMSRMMLDPDDTVYALMEEIVENRQEFQWEKEYSDDTRYLDVAYRLKNGKSVHRAYYVKMNDSLKEDFCSLWNREDFKNSLYYTLNHNAEYLQSIWWENLGSMKMVYESYDEEKNRIIEALLQDVENADEKTFREEPVGKLLLEYGDNGGIELYTVANGEYPIYPGFTNVLSILKDKGMETKGMPELDAIEKITVSDYRGADYISGTGVDVKEYTEKEDIKELLPYLVNGSYAGFQLSERKEGIEIVLKWKDEEGQLSEIYCKFREDNLPKEYQQSN